MLNRVDIGRMKAARNAQIIEILTTDLKHGRIARAARQFKVSRQRIKEIELRSFDIDYYDYVPALRNS